MVVGRPSKYTDKVNKEALGYIDSCGENYILIEKPVITNGEVSEEKIIKKEIKLPTVEKLALLLGVSRDSLYEWAKQYPDFSDTLDALKKKQADMLIQNGLSGDYNSTIAKLMLSANHGINERSESESVVKVVDDGITQEQKEALLSLLK